jgi:AcrR family transcriptional regulator
MARVLCDGGQCDTVRVIRPPRQARSIESTTRMLDAAEALIAEGGPDALTVDAVVSRAGTSTGAFYARFGDRLGLLAAVQERFLDRLRNAAEAQADELADVPDLQQALAILVGGFLTTFRANRHAFNAIMVQNRGIPDFRARGSQATERAAAQLRDLLAERSGQITHPDIARAADMTFRTLFALATQIVMMDESEVTGRTLSEQQWTAETTAMLVAYLTAPHGETGKD